MASLPDILGSYRLAKFIRSGNSTLIYEAIKDDGSGRYILKILRQQYWGNKEEIELLKHEYTVAKPLSHPNVIDIMEMHTAGKVTFLVLEVFTDTNIKQVMQGPNGNTLIQINFQKIAEQCANGLNHLHEKGWVHCDVKPDNFLLRNNNEIKLIDFTISRKISRGKIAGLFKRKGRQTQGTRSYMSPEQIRGEPLDARADIYSLGCMYFELLTGRVPYTGTSPNDLLNKHLKSAVPNAQVLNENVSNDAAEMLRRMLSKKPEHRQESCQDVLKEVRGIRPFKQAPRLTDED